MKLKIAISGGIGAGKTLAAKIISDAGYKIIYADEISKEILSTVKNVKESIQGLLGNEAYLADGTPNKEYIATQIFNDRGKLKAVNELLHPPTIAKIKYLINQELKINDMVFVEAALIFEAKMEKLFDYIIWISAEREIRINRIKLRDNTSDAAISERVDNQIDENVALKRADFVIKNNHDTDHFRKNVEFILNLLKNL